MAWLLAAKCGVSMIKEPLSIVLAIMFESSVSESSMSYIQLSLVLNSGALRGRFVAVHVVQTLTFMSKVLCKQN